jgi:hypothetical protein
VAGDNDPCIFDVAANRVEGRSVRVQPSFEYARLPLLDGQIRLLTVELLPSGKAIGMLKTFDFDDAPPYRALSYMWGSELNKIKVLVNGAALKVTESLHEFLQLYAARHPSAYI